jgi:hypothetical protein
MCGCKRRFSFVGCAARSLQNFMIILMSRAAEAKAWGGKQTCEPKEGSKAAQK